MAKEPGTALAAPKQSGWVGIISVVTRPISFFVLALLLMGSAISVVALRSGPDAGSKILIIGAAVIAFAILVVAFMGIRVPTVLMGVEWLREPLAESLAEAVVGGLEGSVTNLPKPDHQVQAWVDLIMWIEREQRQEGLPEREFRKFLVRGIQDRVVKKSPGLKKRIEIGLENARGAP